MGGCLCMFKVMSLSKVGFFGPSIHPEWQLGFIWETPPLSSISCCLCSSLCVSLSCWLGCIMWLMSSGQSAVGTRTRSGDPEADWRRANGQDAATSVGARCQTRPVNYALRRCWNKPPSARMASKHAHPGKFPSITILLVWVLLSVFVLCLCVFMFVRARVCAYVC